MAKESNNGNEQTTSRDSSLRAIRVKTSEGFRTVYRKVPAKRIRTTNGNEGAPRRGF